MEYLEVTVPILDSAIKVNQEERERAKKSRKCEEREGGRERERERERVKKSSRLFTRFRIKGLFSPPGPFHFNTASVWKVGLESP